MSLEPEPDYTRISSINDAGNAQKKTHNQIERCSQVHDSCQRGVLGSLAARGGFFGVIRWWWNGSILSGAHDDGVNGRGADLMTDTASSAVFIIDTG